MVACEQSRRGRRGGALVETAVVLTMLMTFVLGVFEYGRLWMNLQLLNNAAREGCRYALVNNTDPNISSDVQSLVLQYMGGQNANFNGFTVSVTGTSNGVSTPVNNLSPGDLVTVTVSGGFRFLKVVPLVQMPTTISFSSAVTMVCEGGT